MISPPRRRRIYGLVWAAGAVGLAGAVASGGCRDVIGPEPVDLAFELCTLLSKCEGEELTCPSSIASRIVTEEEAKQLLEQQERYGCLESCSSARQCRNAPPVCFSVLEGCSSGADCCGFADGVLTCEAGQCCIIDGASCTPGDDTCCAGTCDSDGRCGDVVCKEVGTACLQNLECCSKSCDAETGFCATSVCSHPDEPCVGSEDCCPVLIEGKETAVECRDGVCTPPPGCNHCDPLASENCCTEQGLVCYVVGDQLTVCGDPLCGPPGAECGSDSDCCQGSCDELSLFPHCTALGA